MQVQKISSNNQTSFGRDLVKPLIFRTVYYKLINTKSIDKFVKDPELLSKVSGNNVFHYAIDGNLAKIVQIETSTNGKLTARTLFSEPADKKEDLFGKLYEYCKFNILGK